MISRFHQFRISLALLLLGSSLAGCASLNERASASMGDYIPQWAGGLPPDAPPRPGTVKYDEWMKEQERERQMPADQRPPDPNAPASTSGAKPPFGMSKPATNTSTTPSTKPKPAPGSTASTASNGSTPSGLEPVH